MEEIPQDRFVLKGETLDKNQLRFKIKEARKELDIKELSRIMSDKIKEHVIYRDASHVMLYYPMKYEFDVLDLMTDCDKKKFYFPKVEGDSLLVCPMCDEFRLSKLKINEPCSNPVSSEMLDLIIVPSLAVDAENYRLGYGGGFYDRFLKTVTHATTITPIYSGFVFEKLPHDDFDVKIQHVITEI